MNGQDFLIAYLMVMMRNQNVHSLLAINLEATSIQYLLLKNVHQSYCHIDHKQSVKGIIKSKKLQAIIYPYCLFIEIPF